MQSTPTTSPKSPEEGRGLFSQALNVEINADTTHQVGKRIGSGGNTKKKFKNYSDKRPYNNIQKFKHNAKQVPSIQMPSSVISGNSGSNFFNPQSSTRANAKSMISRGKPSGIYSNQDNLQYILS